MVRRFNDERPHRSGCLDSGSARLGISATNHVLVPHPRRRVSPVGEAGSEVALVGVSAELANDGVGHAARTADDLIGRRLGARLRAYFQHCSQRSSEPAWCPPRAPQWSWNRCTVVSDDCVPHIAQTRRPPRRSGLRMPNRRHSSATDDLDRLNRRATAEKDPCSRTNSRSSRLGGIFSWPFRGRLIVGPYRYGP